MSGIRPRFQILERIKSKKKNGKANINKDSGKFGCEREKGEMTTVVCDRQELEEVSFIYFCLFLK